MQLLLPFIGRETSALALGCARLGSVLTPLTRRESHALIDDALALGIRHFDTASIYGQGDSERYLGDVLHAHRGEVCLSSKAGQLLTPKQAVMAQFKQPLRWLASRRGATRQRISNVREQGVPRRFDPAYIERSLRGSLERLRTDHLDIFYLHSPDPSVLRDDHLMQALVRLRERGLIRAIGVSCDEGPLAHHAAVHEAVQVVQFAWTGAARDHQLLCDLSSRGKVALLRGFMSRRADAGVSGLVQSFENVLGLPALGGLLVGTTNRRHLRENVEAFDQAAGNSRGSIDPAGREVPA